MLGADLWLRVCLYKGIQMCVYVYQILDRYMNLFKRGVPQLQSPEIRPILRSSVREICSSSNTKTRGFIH